MSRFQRSIVAAFIATVVLSGMMVVKSMIGMLPAMNAIAMLTHMAHQMMGAPASPIIGWGAHFLIGTLLWGVMFALVYDLIPGDKAIGKALQFSIVAWLLMMVFVMPMAGQGLFAMHIGVMAAVATLVLHLLWGSVLGGVYQSLPAEAGSS